LARKVFQSNQREKMFLHGSAVSERNPSSKPYSRGEKFNFENVFSKARERCTFLRIPKQIKC
jgi:hypothetical protein